MSENVTHTGILDDCFRLMQVSDEICDAFKEVAESQNDFARLGGITRSGDRFTVQLLESFRQRWAERKSDDKLEPKLAFVLGWLTHRAADRQMKPVFRDAEPNPTHSPTDCSVYHDAFVFKEVFAGGKEAPYNTATFEAGMQSLPVAAAVDSADVEAFFRALLQRALIEMHTFIPDRENIEPWLEKLSTLQQRFNVDIDRYAAAIYKPDPEKVKRFITDVNFYDPNDPIIVVARGIQRIGGVTASQVKEAAAAEAKSHYGQALQMGYGYLCAASEFFKSDMEPEVLKARLDIGKAGRDGKSV